MNNYSIFTDCNSETLVLRIPYLTAVKMLKNYDGNDKEHILLLLERTKKGKVLKDLIDTYLK